MNNYSNMTVKELRDAVYATGTNPFGMTKAMMVDFLYDTDRARSMSTEELYAYLVSTGRA